MMLHCTSRACLFYDQSKSSTLYSQELSRNHDWRNRISITDGGVVIKLAPEAEAHQTFSLFRGLHLLLNQSYVAIRFEFASVVVVVPRPTRKAGGARSKTET